MDGRADGFLDGPAKKTLGTLLSRFRGLEDPSMEVNWKSSIVRLRPFPTIMNRVGGMDGWMDEIRK